jgi:hypothetical protein
MLTLTPDELRELTGYRQPAAQLAELHRQGFYRARRNVLGAVVLERAHYDAVAAGRQHQESEPQAPLQLRPPRLRSV